MLAKVSLIGHKNAWWQPNLASPLPSSLKKIALSKNLWLIIALLYYNSNLFSQSNFFGSDSSKKLKVIVFYKWGKPNFSDSEIYKKCEDSIQNKYAFKFKIVGGFIVRTTELIKFGIIDELQMP